MAKRYTPGSKVFLPYQAWPQIGSRWPVYNVESDQADGLIFWASLHGDDVLRSVLTDQIESRVLVPVGSPGWVGDDTFGQRLLLDGSSQYVEHDSVPSFSLPITMSCWVKQDSARAYDVFFSLEDMDGNYNTYVLMTWDGGNDASAVHVYNDNGTQPASAESSIAVDQWTLVVGRFINNSSRNVTVYPGEHTASSLTSKTAITPDHISIGVVQKSGASKFHLDGAVADPRVYDHDVPDDLIVAMYERPTRWELYEIPRHVWAVRWVEAGGQPMSLRGTTVPHLRQWQPRVGS